ncbi:hypothetical protein KO529_16520 [Arenibacter algicola]|uniref:hypothetical protein n=1 Tax=Arenibacter algicola TaxID=616991 RepID=UPI001C074F98|nr:hypothetical protein [Arenibacter algicola]MBU2906402.1 hypothetical protein [Arenibacter algicola]
MTNIYEIEKPATETNYFTIGIKYVVLFIVLFLTSWIAIPLFIAKGRGSRINPVAEFLAENPLPFSLIFSATIIAWFVYWIRKKYKYGEVFKINFDDATQILNVWTINTMNKAEKAYKYDYETLDFKFYKADDALFGKQRILHILKNQKTAHEINFDRTAWCRNEGLENLIERIKTGHNKT